MEPAGAGDAEHGGAGDVERVDGEVQREEGVGLQVRQVQVREQAKYPLILAAAAGKRMGLKISYDRRRYEGEVVRRMARQLKNLLEEVGQLGEEEEREGREGERAGERVKV